MDTTKWAALTSEKELPLARGKFNSDQSKKPKIQVKAAEVAVRSARRIEKQRPEADLLCNTALHSRAV